MNRRAFLATGVGAVTVATAGCGARGSERSGEYDVGMTAVAFEPATLTVAPGDTVVWKNTSSHAHTVTAYQAEIPAEADYFATGGFDSQSAAEDGWLDGTRGALYEGDTFEHTFETPGEYNYFCIPHEASGMLGFVEVTEPSGDGGDTATE